MKINLYDLTDLQKKEIFELLKPYSDSVNLKDVVESLDGEELLIIFFKDWFPQIPNIILTILAIEEHNQSPQKGAHLSESKEYEKNLKKNYCEFENGKQVPVDEVSKYTVDEIMKEFKT